MNSAQPVDIHGKPYRRTLLVIVLLVGNFCTMLNQTILSTAFPTLMHTFQVSASTVQWLTTGFMLVNGIMIPISAYLLGKFRTKPLYMTAMGTFLVGTFICFTAKVFPMLLVGRLVQAMAVGIALPMVQTIMLSIFPPEKRGTAMGLAGIVVGLAPAIGPTLSGWIIDRYSWRDLFGMIIPIIIIVLILATFFMRDVLQNENQKLDLLSVVLSTLGFGSLLYGFSSVGDHGWGSTTVIASLCIGAVFTILFAWRQLKMENPFLDIAVFKTWRFTLSTFLGSTVFMMMIGVEMVLPMYIQNIRGQDAFHSGLILLPGALMVGIMTPITGRLFDKYGVRRLAIAGLFIATCGTLPLMFLTRDIPMFFLTVVYAIRMVGISMVMMPTTTAGMNALPNSKISHGTAVNNTFRQIMGSVGTAILVSVLSNATKNAMPAQSLLKTNPLEFKDKVIGATLDGYHMAFIVATLFGLIGFALTFFLKAKDTKKGGNR